ncbi:hypothetical protein ACIFOT_07795 [Neobacillus sp. NRS-1170]|uniref:hypothetical protein n=1 Tax=Neobacillus sp. NRS-1170 TaxID=3233898 RepID=UPI003D2D2610
MKKNKVVFWGLIIAASVLVINVLHFLLGGQSAFARGPHGQGHEGMGPRGGDFGHHQFMNGPHHEGGFPWLAIFIGLAVLALLVRWLRKKAKTSSMKQFIDTSIVGSHTPVINQNAAILDQWEKNIITKKETE